MQIVRTKKALGEAIRALRAQGKRIGLVPTMGALHAGHVSLIRIALERADVAVASIFVNPTQFGPNEDFSKYPRTETQDLEKLQAADVAVAYLPGVEEMYAPDAVTRVQVQGINADLEGAFRPGHFDGVATIVTKLLMQALPDIAVFGEKDFQQLMVIRRFTQDLDLPVSVLSGPTLREQDGLAMSSRNRYLSAQERIIAASFYRTLKDTAAEIAAGAPAKAALEKAKDSLIAAGFAKVDYVALRDAADFSESSDRGKPARLLAAAYLGTTRLIDNIEVGA